MYRGQETYPIRVNARYEMNCANSFSKSFGNPIFGQIFGHQRAKNEARNMKMSRGQETHPIRVNARYEMNWANSFFKKFRKPCLQTDGRTDGWTSFSMNKPTTWCKSGRVSLVNGRTDRHRGESSIPPFHLRWSKGIISYPCPDLNTGFANLFFVNRDWNVMTFKVTTNSVLSIFWATVNISFILQLTVYPAYIFKWQSICFKLDSWIPFESIWDTINTPPISIISELDMMNQYIIHSGLSQQTVGITK